MWKDKNKRWLYLVAILLIFPALLINLGLLTFIDDEAIRALVALEMKYSGNYIVPSMHGRSYHSKPPLFNWILLFFYYLRGSVDELSTRLPTFFALLGYAATIYYFFRKHFSSYTAFVNAFIMLTCGRILFWDSMLGLIDITYSWVTFTAFMVVYTQFKKGNYLQLFVWSYLLTGIAFMLKGFPSILFQGLTLLTWFSYKKKFKKLFTWQHILGGLFFVVMIGSFYWTYSHFNQEGRSFAGLAQQSTTRTFIDQGWWRTFTHLFSFPFEMIYHFLPWTLLVIHFFRKNSIRQILGHDFITFLALTFGANIIIYWTSPQVYPRYVLMHAPLIFGIFIYLHQKNKESWQYKLVNIFFFVFLGAFSLLAFAPLFMERLQVAPFYLLKTISIIGALLFLVHLFYTQKQSRLLILCIFLLVTRIGFNWFVLPDRNSNDSGAKVRSTSIAIGETFKNEKLFIYTNTKMQPTNSFYMTITAGHIIPAKQDTSADSYFVIDPSKNKNVSYIKKGEMYMRHEAQRYFDVGIRKKDTSFDLLKHIDDAQ